MTKSAAEIIRDMAPSGRRQRAWPDLRTASVSVCLRRQAQRDGSGERDHPARDRCPRDAGTAFDASICSDRRESHPEDRSFDRPRARHQSRARRRRRLRAGMWAEGTLWSGNTATARIHQIDPETARSFAPSSPIARYRVTWVDGELWRHLGSRRERSARIDPRTGEVLQSLRTAARYETVRASNPTAATSSSAAAQPPARFAPCAGRSGAERRSSWLAGRCIRSSSESASAGQRVFVYRSTQPSLLSM